jgi:hypothetical protein
MWSRISLSWKAAHGAVGTFPLQRLTLHSEERRKIIPAPLRMSCDIVGMAPVHPDEFIDVVVDDLSSQQASHRWRSTSSSSTASSSATESKKAANNPSGVSPTVAADLGSSVSKAAAAPSSIIAPKMPQWIVDAEKRVRNISLSKERQCSTQISPPIKWEFDPKRFDEWENGGLRSRRSSVVASEFSDPEKVAYTPLESLGALCAQSKYLIAPLFQFFDVNVTIEKRAAICALPPQELCIFVYQDLGDGKWKTDLEDAIVVCGTLRCCIPDESFCVKQSPDNNANRDDGVVERPPSITIGTSINTSFTHSFKLCFLCEGTYNLSIMCKSARDEFVVQSCQKLSIKASANPSASA